MIKALSARYYEIQGPNNSKLFYPATPTLNKRSGLSLFFLLLGDLRKTLLRYLPIKIYQF